MMRAAAVHDRLVVFLRVAPLRRTGSFIAQAVVILSFLLSGSAWSAEPVAGSVTAVRGTVVRKQLGSENTAPVRVQDAYRVGDILETGSSSAAQLTLSDETFLNLGPDSAVRVNQYSFNRSTMRRTARIRVLKGIVRFVLFRLRSPDSVFLVETEQANVLPQMIADVAVETHPADTVVAVLGGSARVKNASALVIGEVHVKMNQAASVLGAAPPAPASTVSPEDRRRLLSRLKAP
jgi:hypothetical protein